MPEIESADESVIHLATVAKFDAVLEADVRTQAVPQLVAEASSFSEVTFKIIFAGLQVARRTLTPRFKVSWADQKRWEVIQVLLCG